MGASIFYIHYESHIANGVKMYWPDCVVVASVQINWQRTHLPITRLVDIKVKDRYGPPRGITPDSESVDAGRQRSKYADGF